MDFQGSEITTMFGAVLVALPILVYALVEALNKVVPTKQKVPLIVSLALLCSGVPFYSGLVAITEAQAVMIFLAILSSPAIHGLLSATLSINPGPKADSDSDADDQEPAG